MGKPKQIIIDGRIFDSIRKASKALGIEYKTICRKIAKLKKPNLTLQEVSDERKRQITILDKTFGSIAEATRFLGHKCRDSRSKDRLQKFRYIVRHGKAYTICKKNRPLTFEAIFRIIDNIDKKVWCFDSLEKGFWEKPMFKNICRKAVKKYRHPVLTNLYHRDVANRYSLFSLTSPKTNNKHFFTLSEFFASHEIELFDWHNAINIKWVIYGFSLLFEHKLNPAKKERIWSSFSHNEYPLPLLEECLESMLKMTYSEFRRKVRNLSGEVERSSFAHNQYMTFAEGKSFNEILRNELV